VAAGTVMTEVKARMLPKILGRSLLWALGIFFLMLFIMPMLSGSNLGPIAGIVWAAISFLVSLVVFIPVETFLALGSRRKEKTASASSNSEQQEF
jgi:hypothetical protein